MKVVGLMLASENSEGGRSYADMTEACRRTWISDSHPDVKVYSVYGKLGGFNTGPQPLTVFQDNKLVVDTVETRENLLGKTISAMSWALANSDAEFFFRPNCGSYVNTHLLHKFLTDKPRAKYYSGIHGTHNGIPFCSGSCTLFSRDLVELMVSNMPKLEFNGWRLIDDVAMGLFMHQNGIERTDGAQRINASNDQELNRQFSADCYHYYFMHTINPNLIYRAHELTKGLYNENK